MRLCSTTSRENADFPDIRFTLIEAAGMSPTLVLNQTAKAEKNEAGSLSKYDCQKLQRLVGLGWGCLWLCAQIIEN